MHQAYRPAWRRRRRGLTGKAPPSSRRSPRKGSLKAAAIGPKHRHITAASNLFSCPLSAHSRKHFRWIAQTDKPCTFAKIVYDLARNYLDAVFFLTLLHFYILGRLRSMRLRKNWGLLSDYRTESIDGSARFKQYYYIAAKLKYSRAPLPVCFRKLG